jgi:apolipoprotein D and lipocalin family protein
VDLEEYAGLWYEIASYPQFFNRGLVGTTAEYTLLDDGWVEVFNRGFQDTFDGEEVSITGFATVKDETTNAKLQVRFPSVLGGIFPGPYWIIELDEVDYSYAVVSDPKRSSLFILSRTPTVDQSFLDDLIERLADRGFDPDRLTMTPQQAT